MDVRQVSRWVLLLLWVGVSAAPAEWVQNGQFPVPGIPWDVQLASGRLYVSNATADRIEVFTPEGEHAHSTNSVSINNNSRREVLNHPRVAWLSGSVMDRRALTQNTGRNFHLNPEPR